MRRRPAYAAAARAQPCSEGRAALQRQLERAPSVLHAGLPKDRLPGLSLRRLGRVGRVLEVRGPAVPPPQHRADAQCVRHALRGGRHQAGRHVQQRVRGGALVRLDSLVVLRPVQCRVRPGHTIAAARPHHAQGAAGGVALLRLSGHDVLRHAAGHHRLRIQELLCAVHAGRLRHGRLERLECTLLHPALRAHTGCAPARCLRWPGLQWFSGGDKVLSHGLPEHEGLPALKLGALDHMRVA
mmetsp:Transcript_47884/g.147662  ORF Transcript_47884/g.147662 Transcript_47884/m.147662 type:complete len:241 (-) Transcript_47884:2103-2825(-)